MNLSSIGTTKEELISSIKRNVFSTLNCHGIGKITEFNATKQTCTIQLMQLRKSLETTYAPSLIFDVPLIIYGSNNAYITLPDLVGTTALLFFMDRNIDAFLDTNEAYLPETSRMHNVTDCIAIAGFKTNVTNINNYDVNSINIAYNKIVEEIVYNSVIKNFASSIQLQSSKTEEENDEEVTTTSTITENPTLIQLESGGKIKINNSDKNLLTLIQSLITTIKNIQTTDGSTVAPSSQQALSDISTEFGDLLQ